MMHREKPDSKSNKVVALNRAWAYLSMGLHLLMALLMAVVIVRDGWSWNAVALCFIYVMGLWLRPTWLWLTLVIATWACLLLVAPSAVFMAFALFFLCVGVLPLWPAIVCNAVVTTLSVYQGGEALGPIVAAVVATVVGVGFKELRDEASAREAASRHAGEMGERTRLAGEIHDTIAQGLSSIHMILQAVEKRVEDPEVLEDLRLARTTAEDNLAETRRIIAALQPGPLVGGDLPIALARVSSGTPLGEALSFEVEGEPYDLDEKVEQELTRIAQSLVSNVVKHSEATRARVTLTYQNDLLSLDVVDNGRGMDAELVSKIAADKMSLSPVGLAGVRRRANLIGATMHVESSPGAGCGVSIQVPIL